IMEISKKANQRATNLLGLSGVPAGSSGLIAAIKSKIDKKGVFLNIPKQIREDYFKFVNDDMHKICNNKLQHYCQKQGINTFLTKSNLDDIVSSIIKEVEMELKQN
ncbi:hypothetical protein, partial [Vibrio ichthyoenteri]|uniref:hypothetical protein n=1 Tax=Vibrio ichthyoenteri TaxID=142461 RepID=UPI00135F1810